MTQGCCHQKVGENTVKKTFSLIGFKALTFVVAALSSTTAQANSDWNPHEFIEIAATGQADLDFVVTRGFLHEMDLASFEVPALAIALEDIKIDPTHKARKSGWAGLVEVELDEDKILELEDVSTFSDAFATTERDAKLSGFYTMRYEFASKLPFRPYAGAGLGVVTTTNETDTSGIIAGRATAGFDLTLGEGSAVFAEYAFVKNGGVNLGSSNSNFSAIPDSEHSLKLGFRRNF